MGKQSEGPTQNQLERTRQDWETVAGEPVQVEHIKGTIYGFTTELGALRLYYKYHHSDRKKISAAYSHNLNTWYFALDVAY
jgi:hypothetical protein